MDRAFEILAAEYRPMVVNYLRALVNDEHLAEDLTQETLIAAQSSIDVYDVDRSFGGWLRGIARNKALQDRRAASRRPLMVDSDVVEGMEQVYSLFDQGGGPWSERIAMVRRCMDLLKGRLREAVASVYERGESIAQAATGLGVSFDAMAQRLSRARASIRVCVERSTKQETRRETEEPSNVRAI